VSIDTPDVSGLAAALAEARGAAAILLCLGEAATMSGEAASRARLSLPGAQQVLAEAVLAQAREQGTPVIAVLFSGRPLTVGWLTEQADAVLAAGFPGAEAGPAVVDVLTGQVSPSGRTLITWPREVGQVPVFFAQRPSGRPVDVQAGTTTPAQAYTSCYLDVPNEPLFAFGHGLTYGRFTLSNLRVTPAEIRPEDTVVVTVDLVNEGSHAAEETVFVFTHDPLASVARPLLELRAVGHRRLAPGERGSLTLTFPASALAFLGPDLTPLLEPGEIEMLVGPCAQRSQLLESRVQLLH
jgi:beta-glucosidase